MIFDQIAHAARYHSLSPRFAAAFRFLAQPGLDRLPDGKIDLVPGEVWATVMRKAARPATAALFENHRRFADIQCCLQGDEQFGWHPGVDAVAIAQPFDEAKDAEMLAGPVKDFLPLRAGWFAVVFPGEPHAPLIGTGHLTKVVLKVLVD